MLDSKYTGISENEQVDKAATSALSIIPEKMLKFHIWTWKKNQNKQIYMSTKAA